MGKTNRREPKRARSSEATETLFEFEARFPDDDACLAELVRLLYPDGMYCPTCKRVTKHHRVKARTCYECQFCGHQEYPMVGTIFEGSSTSLRLWFYGMYLMASTRCGISAKQLERELGVSYPTAWRMFNKIRSLLADDDELLSGTVEMDEAYFGGQDKWKHRSKRGGTGRPGKSSAKRPVFGMVQRRASGAPARIVAKAVENTTSQQLFPHIQKRVLPGSVVYTDEFHPYDTLGKVGYHHKRIPHSMEVYVDGDVHTQTIEGFWSLVKRGIGGVYHGVSVKHLQSYLDEYAFRYNNRETPGGMFSAFLNRIEKRPSVS